MTIEEILWVERFEWKIWGKHNVSREEVEQILRSARAFYFIEKGR